MLIDRIAEMVASGLAQEFEDFEDFCNKYLRHHFKKSSSIFHEDLKLRLQDILVKRNQKDVWISPRGNAKSTIISLAYILYCICTGRERYIILVSDTHSQSKQFLADIKIELETNGKLQRAYPAACGKGSKWATEEIVTRNNIKVDALGMRGKIRGRRHGAWRPTLIIIDDPENDESVVSPRGRERTLNWLMKSAVAAGVPGHTNIVVIGTVINAQCLVQTLSEGEVVSGWNTRVYKSIIDWPTRMDLWEEWEEVYWEDEDEDKANARQWYEDRKDEMDEGATVLWEVHEPLYDLMVLRCNIGRLSFESEKQNSAVNPEQCKFGEEWTNKVGFWWDELPGHQEDPDAWRCFGSCDPSLGADGKRGDFQAIITIWVKPGTRWAYIDADLVRMDAAKLIEHILDLHQSRRYEAFAFETNGFQTVLKDILATRSGERNLWLPIVCITHKKRKEQRIERLAPYLDAGYFRFKRRSKGINVLIKQIKMFPIGDHDDGPDALEMCLNLVEAAMRRSR